MDTENNDSVERTFEIPAVNMARFETMLVELAKRGARLAVAAVIGFEVLRTFRRRGEFLYRDEKTGERVHRWTTMNEVRVFGPRPCYEGWSLVGRLDFASVPGACVRAMVPGEVCPPAFYEVAADRCDHCGHRRRRNDTFLVRHESGEIKVVGRTCLADFLGHASPEAIATLCELLGSLDTLGADAESDGWGGGRGFDAWEPEEVLELAAFSIRSYGWASSREDCATRDDVLSLLVPCIDARAERARKERLAEVTDHDRAHGRAALAWVREQTPDGDYMHNLATVLGPTAMVTGKTAGIAVSGILAYDRAMERETKRRSREALPTADTFVAEPKKRIDCEGTIELLRSWETQWGCTTLVKWRDADGNVFVWKSSSSPELSTGDTIKVRGTVKAHETYKGELQNVLTRCKVEVVTAVLGEGS